MGERADRVRSAAEGDDRRTGDAAEPAAIASEIEQTRAELSETIGAIQDRLAPERLTDQAMDAATEATEQARDAALAVVDHAVQEAKAAVRELTDQAKAAVREATVGRVERVASRTGEAAGGFRTSVVTTIQQNPVPAALVGVGLGWMLLNRPSTSARGQTSYASQTGNWTGYAAPPQTSGAVGQVQQAVGQVQATAGQAVDHVQQTAGQVTGQVQETAGQVVEQVQQAAGQVVDQVQETAGQARGRLEQMLHDNPLQVGVLALALGGALGLAAPPTSREQHVMGEARDRLVDRAQETAQETMQKVQRVAEEAGGAAADEARYQGLTPES